MNTNILVTFATRAGSSEEVAQTLAEALRSHALPVDLRRATDVHSIDQFTAVAICAALYAGRLHKDVRRFLSAHREVLTKIPVALFVLGPVHSDEKEWTGARQQLEKELKTFPWLSPVLQEIVGGKFDPTRLGFPFNLLPALRKMPASDVRDWKLIERRSKEMAVQFHSLAKNL
jgi:menaquinone-dependent protoporphyrinogen oxidase